MTLNMARGSWPVSREALGVLWWHPHLGQFLPGRVTGPHMHQIQEMAFRGPVFPHLGFLETLAAFEDKNSREPCLLSPSSRPQTLCVLYSPPFVGPWADAGRVHARSQPARQHFNFCYPKMRAV